MSKKITILDVLLFFSSLLIGGFSLYQLYQLGILSDELGASFQLNFFTRNGLWLSLLLSLLSFGLLLLGFIKEGSGGKPNTPKFRKLKTLIVIAFLALAIFINFNTYNQRLGMQKMLPTQATSISEIKKEPIKNDRLFLYNRLLFFNNLRGRVFKLLNKE